MLLCPLLKDGATLLRVVIRILHIHYNVAGWYYPTSEQFYIIQCGHPNSKYTLQWHCVLLPHLLKDSSILFLVVSQTPQILYNGIVSSSSLFKDRAVFLNHQAFESRAILLNDITLHWTDSAVFLNPHASQRTALFYWIISSYFEQIVQCFWIMPFKGQGYVTEWYQPSIKQTVECYCYGLTCERTAIFCFIKPHVKGRRTITVIEMLQWTSAVNGRWRCNKCRKKA